MKIIKRTKIVIDLKYNVGWEYRSLFGLIPIKKRLFYDYYIKNGVIKLDRALDKDCKIEVIH